MGISVVRCKRNFHNLTVKHKQMHLLDEPHNLSAAFAKNNLAHQMRYSIELLEATLRSNGTPHVLQLKLEGEDKQNPSSWTLYADGERVAHGTGEFAQECFLKNTHVFLDTCQNAINFANLPCWSEHDYQMFESNDSDNDSEKNDS